MSAAPRPAPGAWRGPSGAGPPDSKSRPAAGICRVARSSRVSLQPLGRASTGAADDEIGELGERRGPRSQGLEGGDRRVAQLPRPRARGVEPRRVRIGGLLERRIGAGRLAEEARVALDVENVVLDLEG